MHCAYYSRNVVVPHEGGCYLRCVVWTTSMICFRVCVSLSGLTFASVCATCARFTINHAVCDVCIVPCNVCVYDAYVPCVL